MKTAKSHNAPQVGESEAIANSGLNVGLLERLFEAFGVKFITVKAVKPTKPKPKRKRKK